MSVIYPKPANPPDPDTDYRKDEGGYGLPEEEAYTDRKKLHKFRSSSGYILLSRYGSERGRSDHCQ